MVRTKEELLNSIKSRLGDDTGDDALSLIEDITDTFDDYDTRVSDSTDWKAKYEQNDADWRQKYRDRFFSSGDDEGSKSSPNFIDRAKVDYRYEDLFKEG